MIRKFLVVLAALCLLSTFTVSAKEAVNIEITAPEGFYVLGEDNNKVAAALGIEPSKLSELDDLFLAVDKENKRQIRLTVGVDSLSEETVNMSYLSNDTLLSLAPQITGVENARGEVVTKDGQKFVKIQLRSADEGGDYVLTRYFTVAGGKSYVLSFYTDIDTDREYIEATFETLASDDFLSTASQKRSDVLFYGIAVAAVIFFAVCIFVTITVIRDIKKEKEE